MAYNLDQIVQAIWSYNQAHVDHRRAEPGEEEYYHEAFMEEYHDLMQNLQFPLKVYRGMKLEGHGFNPTYSDPVLDHESHADYIEAFHTIDFSRIGVFWTWDRETALAGGQLGDGLGTDESETHVVFEATVSADQVDIPTTLMQNLTVYEEEQEATLRQDVDIQITNMTPNPHDVKFPIKANTGDGKGNFHMGGNMEQQTLRQLKLVR